MNNVSFFEIQAEDPSKAIDFYSKVFGWSFVKQEGLPISISFSHGCSFRINVKGIYKK